MLFWPHDVKATTVKATTMKVGFQLPPDCSGPVCDVVAVPREGDLVYLADYRPDGGSFRVVRVQWIVPSKGTEAFIHLEPDEGN
jgi:hypothetical protein